MHIRKGDTVYMRTGKDRGKRGKVLRLDTKRNRVLVEGMNVFKKHSRPKTQGAKGEIVQISKPVAVGTVQLFCPSCNRPTRTGIRIDSAKRARYCKRCKTVL